MLKSASLISLVIAITVSAGNGSNCRRLACCYVINTVSDHDRLIRLDTGIRQLPSKADPVQVCEREVYLPL